MNIDDTEFPLLTGELGIDWRPPYAWYSPGADPVGDILEFRNKLLPGENDDTLELHLRTTEMNCLIQYVLRIMGNKSKGQEVVFTFLKEEKWIFDMRLIENNDLPKGVAILKSIAKGTTCVVGSLE